MIRSWNKLIFVQTIRLVFVNKFDPFVLTLEKQECVRNVLRMYIHDVIVLLMLDTGVSSAADYM